MLVAGTAHGARQVGQKNQQEELGPHQPGQLFVGARLPPARPGYEYVFLALTNADRHFIHSNRRGNG